MTASKTEPRAPDHIEGYFAGFEQGFKPADGPMILFFVDKDDNVVLREYNDYFEEIIEAIAQEHGRDVEFLDRDHYYPDSLETIKDYLKDEGDFDEAALDALDDIVHFDDYKKQLDALMAEAGMKPSELLEDELRQAEDYYNAIEHGIKTAMSFKFSQAAGPGPRTDCIFFDGTEALFRHVIALGGAEHGILIHDAGVKDFLAGDKNEVLRNIESHAHKNLISAEVARIVENNPEKFKTAHAYLVSQSKDQTGGRED